MVLGRGDVKTPVEFVGFRKRGIVEIRGRESTIQGRHYPAIGSGVERTRRGLRWTVAFFGCHVR